MDTLAPDLNADSCRLPDDYSFADAAALYSTLTGVLAGVAFTALVLFATLLTARGQETAHTQATARALLVAFLAFVLASVGYATLAGEVAGAKRLADDEIFAAVNFGAAAIILLNGLALLFESSRLDGLIAAARTLHRFSGWVVPSFVLLNVYAATVDYGAVKDGAWLTALVFSATAVCLVWAAYVSWRTRAGPQRVSSPSARVPTAALLVSVGSSIVLSFSSGANNPCRLESDLWIAASIVGLVGLSLLSASASLRRRHVQTV